MMDVIQMADASSRRDLTPASAIPLAYFACAHLGLAWVLIVLILQPDLPGGFFYHPKMVALVHVVTLAWLSGSILGAFYIVGPLALRLPMPARWPDWAAFAAFAIGTDGMVSHFWIGTYNGMAWAAALVVVAIGWVASRAWRGLPAAPVPWPVKLHVALAFFNILAAAIFGIVIGLDRSHGFLNVSPIAAAYAHLHLAAIGWATMMVVGLSYRLIPMMLPAAMPTGNRLALSAIFIEGGLVVVVVALIRGPSWLPLGGALIAAGLASFVLQIRLALRHRLPRPPALPKRDWSTWQTHLALCWLIIATGLGLSLSIGVRDEWRIGLSWIYGVAGLVGFLAQIVVGMQGRLVPLYAWYRAMVARGGPPERAANQLPSPVFARVIFSCWGLGVPALAWGFAAGRAPVVATSAALLLCGVIAGAAYLVYLVRAASGRDR